MSTWKPGPQVQAIPTPMHRPGRSLASSAPPGPTAILNYAHMHQASGNNYGQFSPPMSNSPFPTDVVEVLFSPNHVTPPRRETGIIEKLLQNFGFVQCCDRQARLFFHFSQYSGVIDDLKNGDEVEFEAGVDRRTGKPIALNILKHNRQPQIEHVSDKRYLGEVTYAPKHNTIIKPGSSPQTELGRLSYENKGEWYFLSFTPLDVSGDLTALKQGDKVSFRISTDGRTSSMKAREVRLEESAATPKHQGVVCSLKDNFGFVERADCVKEIFFHFSEFMGEISDISVGDDVEFEIHSRNNKEVATSVFQLPAGTVQFEDVRPETRRGVILRPIPRAPGKKPNPDDPLPARLKYKDEVDGDCEIVFGDRDQNGEYTLLHGDQVTFNLAIDKRDALKRATNVTLLEESLRSSGEKREKGSVATLKDGFGFVNCHEKGSRLFFHFSEILDQKAHIKLNDEVEFSIITTDSPDKQNAVRLKIIGSSGAGGSTRGRSKSMNASKIGIPVPTGHSVLGTTGVVTPTMTPAAAAITVSSLADGETVTKCRGFVASIRHTVGFIESEDHANEYIFQLSNCVLASENGCGLEVGEEVEFLLRRNGEKTSADTVTPLPKNTIKSLTLETPPALLTGVVSRGVHTPNESDAQGLIKEKVQDLFTGREFRFGAYSVLSVSGGTTSGPRGGAHSIQSGDIVNFRIATVTKTGEKRAVEVKPLRPRLKAKVNCIKGEEQEEFGFITHETPEGKMLFFHQSEVADGVRLKPNDEVEYEVSRNPKTNKFAAVNIKRISTTNTPTEKPTDRLSQRVRTLSLNNPEARVAIIREPYTSDGTKGFQFQRTISDPSSSLVPPVSGLETAAGLVVKTEFDEEDEELFSGSVEEEIPSVGAGGEREDGSGDNIRDDEKPVMPAVTATPTTTNTSTPAGVKSCGDS